MGLFSSKKKTTVHTAVQRMVEDSLLPSSGVSSVLRYILKDGSSISDYLIDGMSGSLALKAERMYEFAERGDYYYGLPKSTLLTTTQAKDVVRQVIESLEGLAVTLDYYEFAPLNNLHVGWQHLTDVLNYNVTTNEIVGLSAQIGHSVYLDDMVPVYTPDTFAEADPGTLAQWGVSPKAGYTPERKNPEVDTAMLSMSTFSPYIVDSSSETDGVLIHYVWEVIERPATEETVAVKQVYRGSLFVPVIDVHPEQDGDYHHVKYSFTSEGITKTKYWLYLHGSNTHPEIESAYRTDFTEIGTYFPWLYFRHDKQNRTAERYQQTPEFISSKKLCKYLGLDYVEMGEAIHQNPDIGDVEQAMTIMAIPANSTNALDCKYLYEYFNALYFLDSPALNSPDEILKGYSKRSARSLELKDAEFRMRVGYQGITRITQPGVIGKERHYIGGIGQESYTEKYRPAGGGVTTRTITTRYHYYRKQVTAGFYVEVRVYGLKTSFDIWRGKTFNAAGKAEQLLIPVDRAISGMFSLPDREILFSRSLHLIFNTRVTTKVKWYQSGWFKIFMVVVAVVLTVLYPPGGAAMWAAIAAQGVAYLVLAVVAVVVAQFAVSYAIQRVAEALGAEWALIVAVALIAYGGYQALGKAGSASLEAIKAATANNFVRLGTSLTKAAFGIHQADQAYAFNKEIEEFELYKDARNAELEEARKLLDVSTKIDPFEFIGETPLILWGEQPQDMYNRTVHSGNIGLASITAVSSYVDFSLSLPSFQDTSLGFMDS